MKETFYKPNLHVGSIELNRSQNFTHTNLENLINPFIVKHGLVILQDFQANLSNDWLVTKTDNFTIKVNKGSAFAKDVSGRTAKIQANEDIVITAPAIDGTYKVLLSHVYSNLEQGTITLTNGSAVVTGSGTKFTEYFATNRLLITEGAMYFVAQVNSDTELFLSEAYTGATLNGLRFSVGGKFTAPDLTPANNNIYRHDAFQISVTTSPKADNELWLAEIQVIGGIVLVVTDKRAENIFQIYSENPKFTFEQVRNRKKQIYRPTALNNGSVNAEITGLSPEILLSNDHVTDFTTKLAVRFYKSADDKELMIDFYATYSNGLPLDDIDKVKYQLRADIVGQGNGSAVFLSSTQQILYDVSSLPVGYYTLLLKARKVTTAFDCKIFINEISLKGNLEIVISEN